MLQLFRLFLRQILGRSADAPLTPDEQLTNAVRNKNLVLARLALKQGANPDGPPPNTQEFTPLILAIIRHDEDMVQTLLGAGANPHKPDALGFTPLAWTMLSNFKDIPEMDKPAALRISTLIDQACRNWQGQRPGPPPAQPGPQARYPH